MSARVTANLHPAPEIAVNARYRAHPITGQQRYAHELVSRLQPNLILLEPDRPLAGLRGHAWEQFVLPRRVRGRLLWSPCQSGPVIVSNQVVTFHDLFTIDEPQWFSGRMSTWYRQLLPRLAKTCRAIISVSEFTKQRLQKRLAIAGEKIRVIYNGVGEEFSVQSAESIECARVALSLPSANYLLTLGSLEPRKNLPRLMEAWNGIQGELPPDLWLVIAGMKGKSSVFSSSDAQLTGHRVLLTGYVDHHLLPGLYGGARALLHPSLAEGFGLPVLEAMACGTPSLAANTSSLPEVTGDASVLVDPLRTDAIARGIFELVHSIDLRDRLRVRGLQWVKRFTWRDCAARTLKVLQEHATRTAP